MNETRQTPASRRIVLTTIFVPVIVLGAVLFCFDPTRYGFYPGCAFHQTTGLLCAGCGATRALYQLLHGHVLTALRYNPLLIVSLPVIGWFAATQLMSYLKNQPRPVKVRPVWLWFTLGTLVAFTVVRNLPGIPPAMQPPDEASPGLHATR